MKKALPFLILLAACGPTITTKKSPELTEDAVAIKKLHSPAEHKIESKPETYYDWWRGEFRTGLGTRSVNIPERWGVVFQCQHGEFTVWRKSVYDMLDEGDAVDVHYCEVYEVADYGDEIVPTLVDYDFLFCRKKP